MLGYHFHNMDINQLIFWIFCYSFLGWCMECVVIRHEHGRWENRGFAKLPFCIIYGLGTFIAFNLFASIQDNYVLLYIAGAICATIFEYATAVAMKKLFGEVWWNYEDKKFNYKGVICLESSLAWGILALLIFKIMNKYIEYIATSINHQAVMIVSTLLLIAYLIDFTYHFTICVFTWRSNGNVINSELEQ